MSEQGVFTMSASVDPAFAMLKEQIDIDEAVQYWTSLIQNAAWHATLAANKQQQNYNVPCILEK
jgi:hypothetical protein